MTRKLNLADIQGNVVRAYGKYGYPKARYFFLNITNAWVGREFLDRIFPYVTTAERWPKETGGPPITLNVGVTFMGLFMMEVPTRTLRSFPAEYIDGMRKRAFVLGDRPPTAIDAIQQPVLPGDDTTPDWMMNWDPIWKQNRAYIGSEDVHFWVSMNAKVLPGSETVVPDEETREDVLEARTKLLQEICASVTAEYAGIEGHDARGEIKILSTNGKNGDKLYQDASAVFEDVVIDGKPARLPSPAEHFGMADGIGDPVFEGQFEPHEMEHRVIGRGKWMDPKEGWQPLATGEFLLDHPDESQELPPAPVPAEFGRNGTFMAYRKLHENVDSFREYFKEEAKGYAKVSGLDEEKAETTLKSKVVGRWPDGVPLAKAPTWDAWQKVREEFEISDGDDFESWKKRVGYLRQRHASDFKYATDICGYDAPATSHLRRVNPRDYLDPYNKMDPKEAREKNKDANTALNKRRRIMRRGLPYGSSTLGDGDDETEQGVAMMILCASLVRQFEFVQQQWIQYGLDFHAGNNTCPLLGDHSAHDRFVVPGDPDRSERPYVCGHLKNFVEPRGGEYFFIPSMTALRMLADGSIDPT